MNVKLDHETPRFASFFLKILEFHPSSPVNLHQLLEGSELVTRTWSRPTQQVVDWLPDLGLKQWVWLVHLDWTWDKKKRNQNESSKKITNCKVFASNKATYASILTSPPFNTHNAIISTATCVEENCTSDFLATKQRIKRLSSCSKVDVGQTTQAESHTANTLPAVGRGLCLILIFSVWFCDPSATWEPQSLWYRKTENGFSIQSLESYGMMPKAARLHSKSSEHHRETWSTVWRHAMLPIKKPLYSESHWGD